MVTDEQVRMLMTLINKEKTLGIAAAKAGMTEKTARKYRDLEQLPSQIAPQHTWRTRKDSFEDDWPWVREMLEINPQLEAKTLFQAMQRDQPGKYQDGQLRTLQRRIKIYKATEGPAKEVFFTQVHYPGILCESDFTHLDNLGVTIAGVPFDHMIYHFVLTYSNWETGTICFSESFESLSEGLQNALWALGGVPKQHQTDRLSAAVNKPGNPEEYTCHYKALQKHYGFEARKIQARCPNENGDVEQSNNRFKQALDQALMLRGSRDFMTRNDYKSFLQHLFDQLNSGRTKRFQEELPLLRLLPQKRLDDKRTYEVRVSRSSTINVLHNTYSVHSRLIKEKVQVRVGAEHLEVWYAQKQVCTMPRLRGDSKHLINYRHIIEWLIRKPGAFENYKYKSSMFPTSNFRIAYDQLSAQHSIKKASKEYLNILNLASLNSEDQVNRILLLFCSNDQPISYEIVKEQLLSTHKLPSVTDVVVDDINFSEYDSLLEGVI